MNGSAQNQPTAEQENVINQKITVLFNQNNQLESFEKDILAIVDRLTHVGFRLNSQLHPDNIPSDKTSPTGSQGQEIKTSNSDGVVGRLDNLIDINQTILNRLNNPIWNNLLKNIQYIESHI